MVGSGAQPCNGCVDREPHLCNLIKNQAKVNRMNGKILRNLEAYVPWAVVMVQKRRKDVAKRTPSGVILAMLDGRVELKCVL